MSTKNKRFVPCRNNIIIKVVTHSPGLSPKDTTDPLTYHDNCHSTTNNKHVPFQQQILNAKARHTYVAIMVVLFVLFVISRNLINFLNLRSLTSFGFFLGGLY